ncbi:MAG: hypothetical protein JW810_11540 [Sedimentisphaerales bacterium]|nr:hypothetical protein [Sedimentisphaerales bacterium]
MALMEFNWKPDREELRRFGVTSLAMLVLIALVFAAGGRVSARTGLVLCAAGLVLFGLSRLSTRLIRPIYLLMVLAALPIGWVVTHLVMAVFYYLVITPIGLLFRLGGRDVLRRRYDPGATSYWLDHKAPDSPKRYFNQF